MQSEDGPFLLGAARSLQLLSDLLSSPVVIIDAGARWGVMPSWSALGSQVNVIGFEPEPDEAQELQSRYRSDSRIEIVAKALGSGAGKIPLQVTPEAAGSSFYTLKFGERMSLGAEFNVCMTIDVEVTSLDDWVASSPHDHVDAMKLDVQGAEYDIFVGAVTSLSTIRILQTEMHMNPLYEGAKLFGDNDALLRSHGFELWMLPTLAHYRPTRDGSAVIDRVDVHWFNDNPVPVPTEGAQLFWADAIYIKSDFARIVDGTSAESLLRDAVLAVGMDQISLALDALNAAKSLVDPERRSVIEAASLSLRHQSPNLAFAASRRAHLNSIAQPLTDSYSVDLSAPLNGWGWHDPLPTSDGGWMRWTGPQRESAVHIPVTLEVGAVVSIMIVGAVASDLIRSVILEVNGVAVKTTVTSKETSGVPHSIIEGRVTQTWNEPHSRLLLRTSRTLPWNSIDSASSDSAEYGIAIKEITIVPGNSTPRPPLLRNFFRHPLTTPLRKPLRKPLKNPMKKFSRKFRRA